MATPKPKAFWPLTISTGQNDAVYVYDSSDTGQATWIAYLAAGTYLTPGAVAAEIQSKVNALRSGLISGYSVDADGHFTLSFARAGFIARHTGETRIYDARAFDSAQWGKSNATVTANATTNADGSADADKLVETAVSGGHLVTQAQRGAELPNGTTVCFWGWAKAAERTWMRASVSCKDNVSRGAYFNLGTGALGTADSGVTARIRSLGSGWYEWEVVVSLGNGVTVPACTINAATGDGAASYLGVAGNGIYLGRAQFEAASARGVTTTATSPNPVIPSSMLPVASFLGIDADNAGVVSSQVATRQHQNGWYADVPVKFDNHGGWELLFAATVSLSGRRRGVGFGDPRRFRRVELAYLKPCKTKIALEGTAHVNEAIERLWGAGLARFRWWPDQTDDATYTDCCCVDDVGTFDPDRQFATLERYALKLKLWEYVA